MEASLSDFNLTRVRLKQVFDLDDDDCPITSTSREFV